jgi:hypothetical protein
MFAVTKFTSGEGELLTDVGFDEYTIKQGFLYH